jgi:hypothetical protein
MQTGWRVVNQEARTARASVMQAVTKFAAKGGTRPSSGQLELAERLEHAADEKRLAMDAFVLRVFG